jgi:2-dehydropantoate 2-reductase
LARIIIPSRDTFFYSLFLETTDIVVMSMNVLIVGAGAVGAFYGSRLATARGVLVSALCRSNYKAVKANGFQVTSPQYGDYNFKPEHTFANPDEARKAGIRWDYLLVSTKALPDLGDDSSLLEGLVGSDTSIVLVQNGLGVEEPYQKRFPKTCILSGVTIVSAAQPSPGHISHNRWTRISTGPYLPHLDTNGSGPSSRDDDAVKRNETLVGILKQGGVADAEGYDHAGLQFVRWHKIAINAAMNPSSALSGGSTNQAMSNDPELYRHLLGVMNEVLDTAPKVLGKPLPKHLATAEKILRSTKKNSSGSKPSMAIDWEQGRRMELEVILGNPIRIAREKGLEMPRLQSLYALLRMAQENREQEGKSKL